MYGRGVRLFNPRGVWYRASLGAETQTGDCARQGEAAKRDPLGQSREVGVRVGGSLSTSYTASGSVEQSPLSLGLAVRNSGQSFETDPGSESLGRPTNYPIRKRLANEAAM